LDDLAVQKKRILLNRADIVTLVCVDTRIILFLRNHHSPQYFENRLIIIKRTINNPAPAAK